MTDSKQCLKTISEICDDLKRHLCDNNEIEQISVKFAALNSNSESVKFVYDLLKQYSLLPTVVQDGKSNEKAELYRKNGNEMFRLCNQEKAWELYCKSVMYAETSSEFLALAYANRSAVLYELGLYKECLADIERALNGNYPENLRQKLIIRREKCNNGIIIPLDWFETPPKVPEVCLEVTENATFGRFVRAKRKIQVGEILMTETPFSAILVKKKFSHCHECIKLCYNLIPCQICTAVLYCSDTCKNAALNYHKYECGILVTLQMLHLENLTLFPLKIALLSYSNKYRDVHNLITNREKRSISDLFRRATISAIIFDLVEKTTDFFHSHPMGQFQDLVLHHMQTGPSNFHQISELAQIDGIYQPIEIASGIYPFLSLLNHSCSPNVTRFCFGTTIALVALQTIEKDEQLFDNYGYHYAVLGRSERRVALKNQYYFDCECEACRNDWGLYNYLPVINGELDGLDGDTMLKLSLADVPTAKRILPDLLVKLRDLEGLKPSRNFCQIQEFIKQCFSVFGNKTRIFAR